MPIQYLYNSYIKVCSMYFQVKHVIDRLPHLFLNFKPWGKICQKKISDFSSSFLHVPVTRAGICEPVHCYAVLKQGRCK